MPKYGKIDPIVFSAITEYQNPNNNLSQIEICKKYKISFGRFKYAIYIRPTDTINRDPKQLPIKILEPEQLNVKIMEPVQSNVKRFDQQGGIRDINERSKYVKEPIAQRRGSWAGKDSNHPMYKAIIPATPKPIEITRKIPDGIMVAGQELKTKVNKNGKRVIDLSNFPIKK